MCMHQVGFRFNKEGDALAVGGDAESRERGSDERLSGTGVVTPVSTSTSVRRPNVGAPSLGDGVGVPVFGFDENASMSAATVTTETMIATSAEPNL